MKSVLFIGIGNPVPSFIHRRLVALVEADVSLTIVAENGQALDLPAAQIIRIGGKQNKVQHFFSFISIWSRPHLFIRLFAVRSDLPLRQRWRWAVKYFPITRAKTPGVIHIQWLSSVPEFKWLRDFFDCPLVASARGSQLTVYPYTRPGFKAIIKEAIQQVNYIHCVSEDMALACKQFGATPEKVFVNYNGINLQKFSPREIAKTEKKFTMISVGAMMWRKGFQYQLQLVNMLLKQGRDVQLLLLGDGPDREGLQYSAHILKLDQHVTFVGKIKPTELPDWLNRADVYVSTSIAEGLANSAVEAIACGLPVVAFACEGMEEAVRQGNNGFILPVGAVQGIVDKIIYLIDNSNERMKMGSSSRQHAVENFDENRWVSRMVEKYKSIAMHLPPGDLNESNVG